MSEALAEIATGEPLCRIGPIGLIAKPWMLTSTTLPLALLVVDCRVVGRY